MDQTPAQTTQQTPATANPFVFVVGVARSGTTLLQRMLDHHPQLAIANDTHFIPWALEAADAANPPMTPALSRRVAGYRRFHRFGLPDSALTEAAEGAPTYAAFVGRLYDIFARQHRKPFGGEKTPEYVRHIPELAELFPAAKFVHLVRDGRDVALSVMKWAVKDRPPDESGSTLRGPARTALWDHEPLGATALWWVRQALEGAKAGDALGPNRYLEVLYEDLVAAPETTLSGIASFLGLPDAAEMAAYHQGRQRERKAHRSPKSAWMPATGGLRDWRGQMKPGDAALFEALAGDALARFGYPLETDGSGEGPRADLCRRLWAGGARRATAMPAAEARTA